MGEAKSKAASMQSCEGDTVQAFLKAQGHNIFDGKPPTSIISFLKRIVLMWAALLVG
jgi:hypothetical protein